ncbi:universal stress protein, partial [Ruegeria sp. MALMAid1280]
ILHTAAEAGSDLIVIGAHKPDLKDYLLGPNAARVVRHSTVSVYVVR